MTDDDRQTDRFEAAFREWAGKSPRTPAGDAARRVSFRIREGSGRVTRAGVWAQRFAVVCGLVLFVASGVLLWRNQAPPPGPAPAAAAAPVLPENVVIFWLDAETPVYFVVGPVRDDTGGTP